MPFQFLGTSGALPSAQRDNTALAFYSPDEVVLVDCPGSPYQKILKAELDPMKVSALIVTHCHADHTYGLPSLLHCLELAGRRAPLPVYGLAETLPLLRGSLQLFSADIKMRYRVELHEVPPREGHEFFRAEGLRICSIPTVHSAPSIALRMEFDGPAERGVAVYSCDTSPCDSLIAMARGADVLVHDATFLHDEVARAKADGHTTGYQAGEVATRAGVKRLILCHFANHLHDRLEELRQEACRAFLGPVEVPEEFREYGLGPKQPI
jgi:ribonuclease Z